MNIKESSDPPIFAALREFYSLWPVIFEIKSPYHPLIAARSVILLGESLKRSKQVNGKACSLDCRGRRPGGDGTLYDLMIGARNAAAHVFSGQHRLTGEIVVRGAADYYLANAIRVDGEVFDVGFDGDFTLFWGGTQVTANGDLLTAYDWLRSEYGPTLKNIPARNF